MYFLLTRRRCFRCNASNVAGADIAYTYLHVFSPEVGSPAEMSGLVYPMIPLPAATVTTATTSVAHDSTVADRSFAPEPETRSPSTTGARRTDPPRTSSQVLAIGPEVTSSVSRDLDRMSSREADGDDAAAVAVVVVACVSGACLLVFLVLALALLAVRRRRRSGKYDPSRPYAEDDGGCRRLWVPCCPAAAPAERADLDSSAATLKLNTSALSSAPGETSATAGSLAASDRTLTADDTATHVDPVQRSLIGPPSTNDAQSR